MIDRSSIRFAYAHDWLVQMRGGELVLDRIIRRFGPGPIYTLVANGQPLSESIDACPLRTSFLQQFPGAAGRLRRWMLPLMPKAVDRLRVRPDCDILISTSSCVMKGIRPPEGVPHLCYCHSPARYIWSQGTVYDGGLRGIGLRAMTPAFKRWDRRTAANVTRFIAASTYIAGRIRACFGRESTVISPPVRTAFFTPDPTVEREEFWLLAAALEPFKRVDLAIEAANRRRHPLKIAGAGSIERELRDRAGPTVEFVGLQSAERLRDLYRRAGLFLFPSLEDFGIAPVEAMACGCPVVALRGGGALDTVNESCGAFMDEQSPDALLAAVERAPRACDDQCRQNAERFGEDRFDRALEESVAEVMNAGGDRPSLGGTPRETL